MMETDEYPDYVQGPAYLMSTKLARVSAVWSNRIWPGNSAFLIIFVLIFMVMGVMDKGCVNPAHNHATLHHKLLCTLAQQTSSTFLCCWEIFSLSQKEYFPTSQQRLLEASHRVPIFHMEDVYLTGMLSRSIGVKPQYHPGFTGT